MTKKKSVGTWWSKRHRAYKYQDKKKGMEYDLTLDQAKALMSLPCYYCTSLECKGLDRVDNLKGHCLANVIPCCHKCNMIVASIPFAAKMELRESLRNIHTKGILENWKPQFTSVKKESETFDFEELSHKMSIVADEIQRKNDSSSSAWILLCEEKVAKLIESELDEEESID